MTILIIEFVIAFVLVGLIALLMFVPKISARYSHYYSTYCIHNLHGICRNNCKTCQRPCQCKCHRKNTK